MNLLLWRLEIYLLRYGLSKHLKPLQYPWGREREIEETHRILQSQEVDLLFFFGFPLLHFHLYDLLRSYGIVTFNLDSFQFSTHLHHHKSLRYLFFFALQNIHFTFLYLTCEIRRQLESSNITHTRVNFLLFHGNLLSGQWDFNLIQKRYEFLSRESKRKTQHTQNHNE